MTQFWFQVLIGTLSGFGSAVVVDLQAWSQFKGRDFDWELASRRWILGAVSGFVASLSVSAVSETQG